MTHFWPTKCQMISKYIYYSLKVCSQLFAKFVISKFEELTEPADFDRNLIRSIQVR